MRITFCGGAGEVTGSMHLLEVEGRRILLECGLFQGHREEANERNRGFPFAPASIDAVVLSHAHIDHSGNLPGLVKQGYRGLIYATSATRDLCSVMLMDSAHIQESDARWYNKKAPEWEVDPIEPLYSPDDALACMNKFVSVNYDMALPLPGGLTLTFRDAGHVLGSASVVLEERNGQSSGRRFIFSGDVGRSVTPLLRDPVLAADAETLLLESTYGDRVHDPYEETGAKLAATIQRTVERGGKIIVPTFALERAQEVIFVLRGLLEQELIPEIPMFVDSPLTFDITQVFRMHPEYFEEEIANLYVKRESPFYFPGLTYVRETEASKELNERSGPMLIMAASGMCEAGRILHHLRNNIADDRNTILFVGFQAENTLGRRIVDGHEEVKIFGQPHTVRAEVVALNSLSAHADRDGLLEFVKPSRRTCRHLFLVHGEPNQSVPLAARLAEEGFTGVAIAKRGETVEV
jgi:metallo-beta-lactamase family protein